MSEKYLRASTVGMICLKLFSIVRKFYISFRLFYISFLKTCASSSPVLINHPCRSSLPSHRSHSMSVLTVSLIHQAVFVCLFHCRIYFVNLHVLTDLSSFHHSWLFFSWIDSQTPKLSFLSPPSTTHNNFKYGIITVYWLLFSSTVSISSAWCCSFPSSTNYQILKFERIIISSSILSFKSVIGETNQLLEKRALVLYFTLLKRIIAHYTF